MSHFGAKLAFVGLILLGVLGSNVGKEVAKNLTPNEEMQDTVSIVTGFTVALSPIAGLVAWGQMQQNKRTKSVAALVNVDEDSRKRINRKISSMLQQLDRIRNYERHVWGIGDFTPFIRVRRYIKPTAELINNINKLEQTLINYISQYGDEKAVDEALSKATEIAQNLINQLDKAK